MHKIFVTLSVSKFHDFPTLLTSSEADAGCHLVYAICFFKCPEWRSEKQVLDIN